MTTGEQPITRSELREEMTALREEMRGILQHYATKADVAELRVELAEVKTDLIKWMVGLMLSSVAIATTMAIFIQRLIG